jgi:hypothetical protein
LRVRESNVKERERERDIVRSEGGIRGKKIKRKGQAGGLVS